MQFDDPRWVTLRGGYRLPYDPRDALRSLERGTDVEAAWAELWNELHHQGDVGEASYAAIPHLVRIHARRAQPDWNIYAIAAVIDEARQCGSNPDLPLWLRQEYEAAWGDLVELGLRDLRHAQDDVLVRAALAAIALAKRQRTLARMALLTEDERMEMLDLAGWG
jgi:hypothetical protein